MDLMVKPFTPDEAIANRRKFIPDEVIEAVNEMLAEKVSGSGRATLLQRDIIKRVEEKMGQRGIIDMKWMDFEPVYREAGWEVKYDKPGYNETYPASFEFKRK
jgi:hypothetical protein